MLRNLPSIVVRMVLAVLLTGCVTLLVAPSVSLAAHTIDIAAARHLSLGSTVTVKGIVTVPSGAFSSSAFDQGFAIQDRTGGIYVSIQTNLGLQIRQQVEVTGQLADSFGLLILVPVSPNDVKVKGKGEKVEAAEVATGAIGEATEGRLVQVKGTITQPVGNDLPYGYLVFINDGSGEIKVFVNASTGIDVSALQPGQRLEATGFSGQFETQYEVDPRMPSDIRVH
jgi:DNA/RNA endonuclease YhcR with UshA esterase domain